MIRPPFGETGEQLNRRAVTAESTAAKQRDKGVRARTDGDQQPRVHAAPEVIRSAGHYASRSAGVGPSQARPQLSLTRDQEDHSHSSHERSCRSLTFTPAAHNIFSSGQPTSSECRCCSAGNGGPFAGTNDPGQLSRTWCGQTSWTLKYAKPH